MLKKLGVKKITLHPFKNLGIDENANIFNQINSFLLKKELQLLIENVSFAPFSLADSIFKIIEKVPGAKITFDVGHANRNLELDKFISVFNGKIGHIHLHDNNGLLDHLFYEDEAKLGGAISKIKSFGHDECLVLDILTSFMRKLKTFA